MMWDMGSAWGWPLFFGWLAVLVGLGLIVWGVVRCGAPRWAGDEPRRFGEPDAREILERRYARGELSDEQFEAMRRRLTPSTNAYDMT
ncbi:MAG TPA: SHOCT domain-containing protein [Thermomicrobiales bacterium]|nr:SHOCT domain-containing protein [Thermomicrobiales bacterium]